MGLFRRKDAISVEDRIAPQPTPTAPVREPGVPGRCPECSGFGYIDHIDMINRTQTQHCRSCNHTWDFSFDDEVVDVRHEADQAAAEHASADQATHPH